MSLEASCIPLPIRRQIQNDRGLPRLRTKTIAGRIGRRRAFAYLLCAVGAKLSKRRKIRGPGKPFPGRKAGRGFSFRESGALRAIGSMMMDILLTRSGIRHNLKRVSLPSLLRPLLVLEGGRFSLLEIQ